MDNETGGYVEIFAYSSFAILFALVFFYFPALFIYFSYFNNEEILFKKRVYKNIFYFLLSYLLVCGLGIFFYHIFSDFEGAKSSTATRTDIIYIFTAVATLFAPLILVYTFDSWKKQNFEQSRIKAVSQVKESLAHQHKTINLFLIRNSLDDLLFRNINLISNELEKASEKIENLRWNTLRIIQKNYYYFEKSEFDKLIDFHNNIYDIIQSLEQTLEQVHSYMRQESKDKSLFHRNIYLIHPDSHYLKNLAKLDEKDMQECKEYANQKIHSVLNKYDEFLNNILDNIYKN